MTRKDLVRALLNAFLSAEWTDATSACVYLTILGGVLGTALLGATFLRKWSVGDLVRIGYVAMLALAGTVLAGIGWILVMPNHARFHFHFLPRHFFVPGVLMWIILCATLDIILTRLVKKKPGV
jgi:cytochrome bd-type quinol oxidase subunit 2